MCSRHTPVKPMAKFVSPNEMMEVGKKMMLQGRDPTSMDDWVQLANFWAFNISSDVGVAGIHLVAMCMNCPLSRDELTIIWDYQVEAKRKAAEARETERLQ